MSWFPWVQPPARSNLSVTELCDWLRCRAIEFKAPPQFIDAIEYVGTLEGLEAANEELKAEVEIANDALDDLKKKYRMAYNLRKSKRK